MNISEETIAEIIAEEYRTHRGEDAPPEYCAAVARRIVEYIKGRALLAILDQIGVKPESPR